MDVMLAVMILLEKSNAEWPYVKKEMTDPKFRDRLVTLDIENISEKTMKRLEA